MVGREIQFPDDDSMGFVHIRAGKYPYSFHGHYTKEGEGPEESDDNEGWNLVGEAKGVVG